MIKNRISKYFRAMEEMDEYEPQPEPPRVKPSAFIAMPGMGGLPTQQQQGPIGPLSIYDIALAEAKRKVAESRARRANDNDDLEDLSGWFDSSF
jgi:hypothetical protein